VVVVVAVAVEGGFEVLRAGVAAKVPLTTGHQMLQIGQVGVF
jgi:hypothetical protein